MQVINGHGGAELQSGREDSGFGAGFPEVLGLFTEASGPGNGGRPERRAPCPAPDPGGRLREAGLLKARLCRWAAKPRSSEEVRIPEPRRRSTGGSRCNLATGRPGLCGRPLHTASRQLGRPARTDPSARSAGRRGRPGGLGQPVPSILQSDRMSTDRFSPMPFGLRPGDPHPAWLAVEARGS